MLVIAITGCAASDPYNAVVQITSEGQGSGTLIAVEGDLGVVLSCRHVCKQVGTFVSLKWANGETTIGMVSSVPAGNPLNPYANDLALVICERPKGISPLPVGRFHPANGPIVSVGWRDGEFYESVAFDAIEDGGIIKSNQPFIGGMSGGPTLQNGVVVGVAVGSNRRDYSVSSDGDALVQLIESISK